MLWPDVQALRCAHLSVNRSVDHSAETRMNEDREARYLQCQESNIYTVHLSLCTQPRRLRQLFLPLLLLESILHRSQRAAPSHPTKCRPGDHTAQREKDTHQILLSRPLTLLALGLLLRLLELARLDVPLPRVHVKVELAHPLRALVLGQVRRVAAVRAGERARARVELGRICERGRARAQRGCEPRVEVRECGVDPLCGCGGVDVVGR